MVKINSILPASLAMAASLGSTLAHNIRFAAHHEAEETVNLAQTDSSKYQVMKVYTRGYPGNLNPFFYDSGDDSDNPETDWTFIWFWVLFVMVASILAIIIVAYVTSDVLEEGYAEKRLEEKKRLKEEEEARNNM